MPTAHLTLVVSALACIALVPFRNLALRAAEVVETKQGGPESDPPPAQIPSRLFTEYMIHCVRYKLGLLLSKQKNAMGYRKQVSTR